MSQIDEIKPLQVVVLISGSGSNLQALIDYSLQDSHCHIAAVISNRPNAYGLERAKAAGIEAITLDHTLYANREEFDLELGNIINEYQPNLVVLAGFMRILTPEFVQRFKGNLLNIHPSLLPKYPGLHTHRRAIEAKDAVHGVTVHFVTEELDGGPAIIQAQVAINPDDTEETLVAKVLSKEHVIYPLAVQWFCQGRLRLQDNKVWLDDKPLPATGVQHTETTN